MFIQPYINLEIIKINFKKDGREFDGIRFSRSNNSNAIFSAMKGNIPYCSIQKKMNFDMESKEIYLTFGKKKLIVGDFDIFENKESLVMR